MSNTNMIKVLVVDDSSFIRKVVSEILKSSDKIEVVGTAENGIDALKKIRELKPDVITLDLDMPVMDGFTCLRRIMETEYLPVVILANVESRIEDVTIRALEEGAVDFIVKPVNIFELKSNEKKKEIIEKVLVAKDAPNLKKIREKNLQKPKITKLDYIVAIGISTGGPKALKEMMPLIPGDINAGFVIVQHMPPDFTKRLAERLDSNCELYVKEAEEGEEIKAGYAYIAPGHSHMVFERNSGGKINIKLSQDPPYSGHRPSATVMMRSLAQTGFEKVIGVIMTGMGGDGSEGLKYLKEKNNAYVIAQDEQSCVVFGMPKVAIQTGVVDIVLPLNKIADEIIKIVKGS